MKRSEDERVDLDYSAEIAFLLKQEEEEEVKNDEQ